MALIVLDAGVMIGYWDRSDAHHPAARATIGRASRDDDVVVRPASALAESLVGAVRRGEEILAEVLRFIELFPVQIRSVDAEIAEATARLRAVHGTRVAFADAVVIATAQVAAADVLVTTDRGWPDVAELPFDGEVVTL